MVGQCLIIRLFFLFIIFFDSPTATQSNPMSPLWLSYLFLFSFCLSSPIWGPHFEYVSIFVLHFLLWHHPPFCLPAPSTSLLTQHNIMNLLFWRRQRSGRKIGSGKGGRGGGIGLGLNGGRKEIRVELV